MSEAQALEDQDTDYQNIFDWSLFVRARYSCGTKQALPCVEKLTGKHNHTTSIKYVLYILLRINVNSVNLAIIFYFIFHKLF